MKLRTLRPRNGEQPYASSAALDALRALESRVRVDFRKTVVFGLIALIALIVGYNIGGVHAASLNVRLTAYGCAMLVFVFGVAASRTAAREVQRVAAARAGDSAATPMRLTVLLAGYIVAVVSVCGLLGVDIRQLLVGGAVTGIVVGLAAQPVLSNLFAGLVLLFARPYIPGQHVRVLSGAINGPHDGVIVSAGLLYTVLETEDGPLNIPNNTLLASAVGPAPNLPKATDDVDDAMTSAPDASYVPDPGRDAAMVATVVGGAETETRTGRQPE